MPKFFAYVLFSPKYNRIYIGFSHNPEARLLSHNKLSTQGWTRNFRPWTLVYTEEFDNKKDAMRRERELKSARGRHWIREHILKQSLA